MKTVIIGAGLAGLSAAIKLKGDFLILEKESRPGGFCRTEIKNGFVFDYTGHLLHLRDEKIEKFITENFEGKLNKIKRKSFVFSYNVYTGYPYQVNNYGLPEKVIEENLIGFIRAKIRNKIESDNFKKWVISNFGGGIAKNFMFPYNEKLWKYPLEKLTINWMGRFVPSTTIENILKGLYKNNELNIGYNVYFYYPEKGGIESIINCLYKKVEKKVVLNAYVKKVDLLKKIVYYNDKSIKYDNLIVTMSLKEFLKLIDDKIATFYNKLKATSVYALNFGFISKEKIDKNWVYVPEKKFIFYRIGFPHTFSSFNAPAGYSSLFAEISFRDKIPANAKEKCINDLIKMGVIKKIKDIKLIYPMVLKDAYVIYDKERERVLPLIKEKIKKYDIYTAGRWGNWEYSSMEDAIKEGFEVADLINKKG